MKYYIQQYLTFETSSTENKTHKRKQVKCHKLIKQLTFCGFESLYIQYSAHDTLLK